jgi:amidase
MFKKLNLYIFLLFFLITVSASNDEKNSLIEIYDNPNDINLINIVIKDNIDIGGKVTSAGSLALKDNIAKSDAFIIDKLKRANYYILGKANLSEWANFRSEDSVSGWSSLGGQTKHYLDDTYNPCGSSSGSAVAVSMGIVDIAIGTETNGSISCPSSVNGIVGMKPTTGLVSRSGIVPISSSQDTAGPMGASVDIVAKTLEVISGYDENDPATSLIPSNFDFNFSSVTKNISLKGVRLGLLDSENSNPKVIKLHKKIKEIINSLGGEVILINDDRDYPGDAEYYVLLYEFRVGLEDYLKNTNSSMKKITDIIDFNNKNKDIVMPYFGQDIFYKSIESTSYLKYLWSKYKLHKSYKSTKDLLEKYDLDAFIGLTRGPAWKINYVGGDYVAMNDSLQFGSGGYAAHNGMPHITIPYFEINKFPVGISLIGDRWSDKAIIEYASAIEKSRYN